MATDRRAFLKGFALASAAAVGSTMAATVAQAQGAPPAGGEPVAGAAPVAAAKPPLSATVIDRPGSDFMVDVIKSLGIEYIASNPGSSFRSLQWGFSSPYSIQSALGPVRPVQKIASPVAPTMSANPVTHHAS